MHEFQVGDYVTVNEEYPPAKAVMSVPARVTRMNRKTIRVMLLESNEEIKVFPEMLTYQPPFDFNTEAVRRIARLEDTYSHMTRNMPIKENVRLTGEKYPLTADDLLTALHNAQKRAMSVHAFDEEWLIPVRVWLANGFSAPTEDDIDDVIFGTEEPFADGKDCVDVEGLFTPSSAVHTFMRIIENAIDSETFSFDCMISELETYTEGRKQPVLTRPYCQTEMEYFLKLWQKRIREYTKKLPDGVKPLAVRFINQLAEQDNLLALDLKAYNCYGGSDLFPCDWKASEDCLTRLFTLTENPQYANSLGYICYYGRTTEGVPQFDKAFMWFSIGVANGMIESTYKLADMFYNGYGVPKYPKTAAKLCLQLFSSLSENFLHGDFTCDFADVVFRLANYVRDGIPIENLNTIFSPRDLLLVAEYALQRRMEEGQKYGDTSVLRRMNEFAREISVDPLETKTGTCFDTDLAQVLFLNHLGRRAMALHFDESNPQEAVIKAMKDDKDSDNSNSMPGLIVWGKERSVCTMAKKITVSGEKFHCIVLQKTEDGDILFATVSHGYGEYGEEIHLHNEADEICAVLLAEEFTAKL